MLKLYFHIKGKYLFFSILVLLLFFVRINEGLTQDKILNNKLIIDETFLPSISIEDSIYSIKLLQKKLDEILENKEYNKSDFGVSVFSIDQQKHIYQNNSTKKLIPASTTKLITTFAYLFSNYPDYNIYTSLYANSPYHINGVLNSDIYMYGRGNVLLKENDIDSLVMKIKEKGINEIKGDLYADASYFDNFRDRYKYSGDLDEVQHVNDITALGINKNHFFVTVKHNSTNNKADVIIYPNSSIIDLVNNTKSISSNYFEETNDNEVFDKNNIINFVEEQKYGDLIAAKRKKKRRSRSSNSNNVSVKVRKVSDDNFTVTVNGNVNKNYNNTFVYKIEEPEYYTIGVLKKSLEKYNIKFDGQLKIRDRNKFQYYGKDKLLAEIGNPINEMINTVNKNSDNFLAEHFFKINGTFYKDFTSNYDAANYLIQKISDSLNLNSLKCIINDGSGLSRRNKITSETLIDILNYSYKMRFEEIFTNSLSIAGVDGTLRKRMLNTNAENNARAKTGTHRNVSALAGYVTTLDGERLCFSIISNGNYVGTYKYVEDRIVVALSDFKFINKP